MILNLTHRHIGFSLIILLLLASCEEATQAAFTLSPESTATSLTVLEQNTEQPKTQEIPSTPTLTPFPEIDLDIELPEGDPENGFLLSVRRGCHGCHVDENHPGKAPRFVAYDNLPNIFERGESRIADPDYEGRATTNWEYIIESIYIPDIYHAPGEWKEPMFVSIYNPITNEELADIIAWMKTLE